jgi:hypothetical protein
METAETEDCSWIGHVLAFDHVDIGFPEPRTRPVTMVHVEVNLDTLQVERVVPIGPFTLNGTGGKAPPATVPTSFDSTSWFSREYYPAFEEWDLHQQTADSAIALLGKVVKVDPSLWNSPDGKAWSSPAGGIEPAVYTTFYVAPEKVLKGSPAWGTPVAFRVTGGHISTSSTATQTSTVEAGTLILKVGDRVVVFGTTAPRWGGGGDYRPASAYWLTLENSSVWKETDGQFDFQGVTNGMGQDRLSLDALEMRMNSGT